MMYSTTVTRPAGLGGGRSTSCETRPYMYLRRVMRRVVLRPDTDHTVRLRVNNVATVVRLRVTSWPPIVLFASSKVGGTITYQYGNAPLHAVDSSVTFPSGLPGA